MELLKTLLILCSVPALLGTGYLALLALASFSRRPVAPASRRLRFDVVVPAHDEQDGIARTVKSLVALDWPADRFRVVVVADNCSDATAERAAEAGAHVVERRDARGRGKGYALDFAFTRGLADGFADAFVVIDADTVVTRNLLAAFAARVERGDLAVQARNAVANEDASWRTRLMALGFALFNSVRSLGRERLGASCGLRGNGMCITREALQRVPHSAFSIVEDVEYGIRLGETGIRVAYAHEASVLSDMVADERASRSQRQRWERGRSAIFRKHAWPLVRRAYRERSLLLGDLAADLIVPPLSWVVLYTGAGTLVAGALSTVHQELAPALAAWLVASGCVIAYVARGLQVSGMGIRGVFALAWAPFYVLWKLAVMVRPFESRARAAPEWVRTARETETHI